MRLFLIEFLVFLLCSLINDQIEQTYKDLPKAIFIGTEYSAHRFTKKKLFERIRSDIQ